MFLNTILICLLIHFLMIYYWLTKIVMQLYFKLIFFNKLKRILERNQFRQRQLFIKKSFGKKKYMGNFSYVNNKELKKSVFLKITLISD
jgi:hypothetical protein